MIFDIVQEGIREILDECLGVFRTNIMAIVGARTLSFHDFVLVELLSSLGKRTPMPVEDG